MRRGRRMARERLGVAQIDEPRDQGERVVAPRPRLEPSGDDELSDDFDACRCGLGEQRSLVDHPAEILGVVAVRIRALKNDEQ